MICAGEALIALQQDIQLSGIKYTNKNHHILNTHAESRQYLCIIKIIL